MTESKAAISVMHTKSVGSAIPFFTHIQIFFPPSLVPSIPRVLNWVKLRFWLHLLGNILWYLFRYVLIHVFVCLFVWFFFLHLLGSILWYFFRYVLIHMFSSFQLSHYLDIVEVQIAKQISMRSNAFFSAMASHDALQEHLASTCTAIKHLR